jgi:hypothetical protein
LARGEEKSIQTDRVVLVPGPPEEVELVRWMYRAFVEDGKVESDIAKALNERGVKTDLGRPWTRGTVHQVLTNEKYVGNNVYNRISFKLKKKRVVSPADMWIRAVGAFGQIVPRDQFEAAQQIVLKRSEKLTDEQLLDRLRSLLAQKGQLSGLLIDESEDMPSSSVYRSRFNSLVRAYHLIGYTPDRDYTFIEINRQLRQLHPKVIAEMIERIRQLGGTVVQDPKTDLLTLNGEFAASLVIARARRTESGSLRWAIRLDTGLAPDITVAARMDADNKAPKDYYLLPAIDITLGKLLLAEDNGVGLDTYRFDSLDYFFGMAQRARLPEAAA